MARRISRCYVLPARQVSLAVLFAYLQPGGYYFLEDMQTSYLAGYSNEKPTTLDTLLTLVDVMHGNSHAAEEAQQWRRDPFGVLAIAPFVGHVDCYPELCVLVKMTGHRGQMAKNQTITIDGTNNTRVATSEWRSQDSGSGEIDLAAAHAQRAAFGAQSEALNQNKGARSASVNHNLEISDDSLS